MEIKVQVICPDCGKDFRKGIKITEDLQDKTKVCELVECPYCKKAVRVVAKVAIRSKFFIEGAEDW